MSTSPPAEAESTASALPSIEPESPVASPATAADANEERLARRRAFLGRWGVPLTALVAALAVTIRTHFFFIFPFAVPVSNDEGYLAGMALRMIRGHWLPYVDGVSQRGPILYWITTALMRVGGLWSWVPIRLLGLTLAVGIVLLVFALSATLFSPMAAAVAVLVSTYFLSYELNPWDGVGVNGEPLAVVFALAAALLAARLQLGITARRKRGLIITGVLIACAGLSKQMFLIHAVPIGLWILLGPQEGVNPPPWRTRFIDVGWLLAGFFGPYVFVIGLYAVTGHLSAFVYYYQRYGRDIFMDPLTADYMRDKLREQIDRYYLGVAGLGAVWFAAVGQALRVSLSRTLDAPVEPTRKTLRFPPEVLSVMNLPLPGFGLAFVPGMGIVAVLAFVGSVGAIAARFAIRRAAEIPYTAAGLARDIVTWFVLGLVVSVASGILIAVRFPEVRWRGMERLRKSVAPWFAVTQAVAAFAGALFTFRFFPHYFVEFFPFAAIIVGYVAGQSFDRLDETDRAGMFSAGTMVLGGIVMLVIANSALARNVRIRRETDRWYQDPGTDPIVRYVTERTTADQTIFVWGFRAETYLSSHRFPGSRYVYTVYPAGVVPWFQATHEEEERRVVPGSREQLLEDLEHDQPELVIDAGRSMNGRYMYNYPVLRTYLDRKYCFMRYVDGEPVYRRRHGERCPPADY